MTAAIAIVGISSIFPGAPNTASFHDNIINRRSNIKNADTDWLEDSYTLSKGNEPGRIRSKLRASIGDIAFFDPLKYGIMPNSIDGGDPDHYLSLRVASEAINDSNLPSDYDHTSTGVVVGRGTYFNRGFGTVFQHGIIVDQTMSILKNFLSTTQLNTVREKLTSSLPDFNSDMVGGVIPNLVSGRIANKLGLGGPNFLIDAACASSLIAVEHACEQLNLQKADLMLVGGVQASTPPQVHMVFDLLDALAQDHLTPFSKAAAGTVLSEGVGFVVLSRLEDAKRLGLNIYATIESVASSSDGRGKGLFAPSSSGQQLAIQRAYENHQSLKTHVRYLETHGTGMPLGDETELKTLISQFFGDPSQPPLHLSNLKSLIGHCIPASGIAGLISATLAVKYGAFPPFEIDDPIDLIGEHRTRFQLSSAAQPWLGNHDLPRTAAVNAFGFGGINSHLVVQQYQIDSDKETVYSDLKQPTAIFFLASNSVENLINQIESLVRTIDETNFHQLSLSSYQSAMTVLADNGAMLRGYVVASRPEEAHERLSKLLSKVSSEAFDKNKGFIPRKGHTCIIPVRDQTKPVHPVFVYPGEGSQSAGMLRELALYYPIVNHWLSAIAEALDVDLTLIESILHSDPNVSKLPDEAYEINISTGLVFAANMSLNQLLISWGIIPAAHVGHSTGQNSAIFAGGWLDGNSSENLLNKACAQVIDMKNAWSKIEASKEIDENHVVFVLQQPDQDSLDELVSQAPDEIIVSMQNCPDQYVAVIPRSRRDDLEPKLQKCCIMLLEMPVKRPYHTHHFEEAAIQMREYYDKSLAYNESSNEPVYSCTSGCLITTASQAQEQLGSLMQSRVRFDTVINNIINDGYKLFVECGNGSSTSNFVRSIVKTNPSIKMLSSQASSQGGLESFFQCVGSLWAAGCTIDPHYIEHQAKLEKMISDGFNKSSKQVNLNLLMPRAKLDKSSLSPALVDSSHHQAQPLAENAINLTSETTLQTRSSTESQLSIDINHPLLKDHTLPNRYLINDQIPANGLAVVPMAAFIGMGITAFKAKSDSRFILLQNIKMNQWAKAEDDNRFQIHFENSDSGQTNCSIHHNNNLNYTCTLEGSDQSKHSSKDFLSQFQFSKQKKPYPWHSNDLYRYGMFHGPFYQVIKQITHCNDTELEGVINTSTSSSELNTMQILDGLAQTSAFWAASKHGQKFHTFPLDIELMSINEIDSVPTVYKFLIKKTSESSSSLCFDCLLLDQSNNIRLAITAFKHSFIKLPDAYHYCFANCEDNFFSHNIPLPVGGLSINIIANVQSLAQFTKATTFFSSIFRHMWFNEAELKALKSSLNDLPNMISYLSRKECIRYLFGSQGIGIKSRHVLVNGNGGVYCFDPNQQGFSRELHPATLWDGGNCLSIASLSSAVAILNLTPFPESLTVEGNSDSYIKTLFAYLQPVVKSALKSESTQLRLSNVSLIDQFSIQGEADQRIFCAGSFAFGNRYYGWAAVN